MTQRPLILSLFPGIDLLGRAFEEEWPEACLVRGPDLIFGGDIRNFHPPRGVFKGVIGGPPCQAFSALQRLLEHQRKKGAHYKRAENLIPEFERVAGEAEPSWFVMENVPDAPEPSVGNYKVKSVLLNNRWLGEEQNRLRRFSFGSIWDWQVAAFAFDADMVALENPRYRQAVTASTGGRHPRFSGSGKLKARYRGGELYKYQAIEDMCDAQGLPRDFAESLPFTREGTRRAVGNGVPLPMGRAVARAVKRALGIERAA